MNKKVIAMSIIVVMLICFLFSLRNSQLSVSMSEIIIRDISLSEQSFTLTGDFISSGKSFRNYTYTVDEHNLYITIKGGLVTKKYPSGHFSIIIEDENLQNATKVFLTRGKDKEPIHIK